MFASAERLIRLGLVDAAVVGGVDTLCDSVLFGFNSLELVSPEPCRPFDAARNGISIGEAAGFALLERATAAPDAPRLLGYGEASDAHHMSTPHPEGLGAELALAMRWRAPASTPSQVDYINLHGTASRRTTKSKRRWSRGAFRRRTHASSTKGFTGHTLGAAGIVEAVIALLAIETRPDSRQPQHAPRSIRRCGAAVRAGATSGSVRRARSAIRSASAATTASLFGRARDSRA